MIIQFSKGKPVRFEYSEHLVKSEHGKFTVLTWSTVTWLQVTKWLVTCDQIETKCFGQVTNHLVTPVINRSSGWSAVTNRVYYDPVVGHLKYNFDQVVGHLDLTDRVYYDQVSPGGWSITSDQYSLLWPSGWSRPVTKSNFDQVVGHLDLWSSGWSLSSWSPRILTKKSVGHDLGPVIKT